MPDRADDRRVEPTFGTTPDTKPNPNAQKPEPVSADAGAVTESAELAALQTQLQTAQTALADHQDKFLRAKAEAENARRRADADIANVRKFAIEAFAGELLPVRDSLELAKGFDLTQGPEVTQKVVEGLALTLKLVDTAFQKFGITLVDPVGEKFDPEKHQAMSMMESDAVPPNHVLKVVQKGYLLNGRLLRPAMVVVAKAKAADPPKTDTPPA